MSDDVHLKEPLSMKDIEREVLAAGGLIRKAIDDPINFVATKGPVNAELGTNVFIWVTPDRLFAKVFSRYGNNDPAWFVKLIKEKLSVNISRLELDPGDWVLDD